MLTPKLNAEGPLPAPNLSLEPPCRVTDAWCLVLDVTPSGLGGAENPVSLGQLGPSETPCPPAAFTGRRTEPGAQRPARCCGIPKWAQRAAGNGGAGVCRQATPPALKGTALGSAGYGHCGLPSPTQPPLCSLHVLCLQ